MYRTSSAARVAEATGPADAFLKGFDHFEVSAHYRHEYHLSDAFAGLDGK